MVANVQAASLTEPAHGGAAAASAAAADAFTSGVSAAYYVDGGVVLLAAVIGVAALRHERPADAAPISLPHPAPSGAHPDAAGRA